MAQLVIGCDWTKAFKLRTFNRYLDGQARIYFDKIKASWVREVFTVEYSMNTKLEVYEKLIIVDQAT